MLVTAATCRQLGTEFVARRVCKARVVNISGPVDLYEVAPATDATRTFFRESEDALDALEAGDFASAARRAGALVDPSGDGPLLLVLSRAAHMLVQGRNAPFDPVWEPPGK
jgi:hypothetical protein